MNITKTHNASTEHHSIGKDVYMNPPQLLDAHKKTATGTRLRPVLWRPVAGSGLDLLCVAILMEYPDASRHNHLSVHAKCLLSDNELERLFPGHGAGVGKIINHGLACLLELTPATGISDSSGQHCGFELGDVRDIQFIDEADALRIAALMFSAFARDAVAQQVVR